MGQPKKSDLSEAINFINKKNHAKDSTAIVLFSNFSFDTRTTAVIRPWIEVLSSKKSTIEISVSFQKFSKFLFNWSKWLWTAVWDSSDNFQFFCSPKKLGEMQRSLTTQMYEFRNIFSTGNTNKRRWRTIFAPISK